MSQLNTRIVLRNDSSVNYASALDLVLLKGEVGFEFTEAGKVKMKVGDGFKTWQELEYFGGEELSGDGASIVVADQKISIAGFEDAAVGARLTKAEDGALVWEVPDSSTVEDLVARVEALERKIATVYNFKGSVDSYYDLPTNAEVGDVYNIKNSSLVNNINAGDNVAWTGEEWDKLAGIADLSIYATTEEVEKISEALKKVEAEVDAKRFEIFSKPVGTLVRMTDEEIRIMCPKDTEWKLQNSGENADSNAYYIGFKAYAPSDDIVSFKEDLAEVIADDTMYYFEGNEFAGIDENGRKYSIVWLPVARFDGTNWTYYGTNSSSKKYIGWYYSVEWYNAKGVKVASDCIRINLSNENCHNIVEPYYMASINVNKLTQNEDEFLILYGGSASDNI